MTRGNARALPCRPARSPVGAAQAIAGEGSNIRRIEARSSEDRKGYVSVSLETSDLKHLEKIFSRLKAIAGVRQVIRRYNVPQTGSPRSKV